MKVVITGGRGFLGRNLAAHLRERKDCEALIFDREDSVEDLKAWLNDADVVVHLAGVNRPTSPEEFEKGNVGFTEQVCSFLQSNRRKPKIIFTSSIQAELGNAYGMSKAKAERVLESFANKTGASVRIFRLKNLFGKWSRPHYNSVTATFCHNIAHDLPIAISDPAREIELSYVDDVVTCFMNEMFSPNRREARCADIRSYHIQLGDLAGRLQAFHEMSQTLRLPDFSDWFNRALYATYLSYVPDGDREYSLLIRSDDRGSLAEFLKQEHLGQIFASRTGPGITRGNHYHHTKTEKFFVVEGEGLIRMRPIEGGPVAEYRVRGRDYQVINIPPGYTHSITNVGPGEMVTIFWSSEIFDPDRPDTTYLPVDFEQQQAKVSETR